MEPGDRLNSGLPALSMGRGDCCALYFMVEDREYEWYNQNVKGMDKSKFAAQKH